MQLKIKHIGNSQETYKWLLLLSVLAALNPSLSRAQVNHCSGVWQTVPCEQDEQKNSISIEAIKSSASYRLPEKILTPPSCSYRIQFEYLPRVEPEVEVVRIDSNDKTNKKIVFLRINGSGKVRIKQKIVLKYKVMNGYKEKEQKKPSFIVNLPPTETTIIKEIPLQVSTIYSDWRVVFTIENIGDQNIKIKIKKPDYSKAISFIRSNLNCESNTLKNSSWIKNIEYCAADNSGKKFLIVGTKDNEYLFDGVPEAVWQDFIDAPSVGKYYHEYIKGRYRYPGCDDLEIEL